MPSIRRDPIEVRIHRLERLLVAAYAIVVAAVLIAGFFSPSFISDPGTEEESPGSLAWIVGALFGGASSSGGGEEILLITGFVGLAVVTWSVVLVVLPTAVRGSLRGRLLAVARVLVGLGLVGSLVPLVFGLMAIRAENSDFGWGGPILIVGMLGALLLVVPAAEPLVGAEEPSA